MRTCRTYWQVGLLLAAGTLSAGAGSFSSDFNSGAPAGATAYGSAVVDSTGGVGGSGCLKLTTQTGSLTAGFILDDLDSFQPIYGFDVSYDVLLYTSSGVPADGMSLCYGPDLPDGTFGEEGTGSGLRFSFDTYDNGATTGDDVNPRAPSIDVAIGGTKLATSKRTIATITTNGFVHVHIRLNADGSLNFDYRGETLFTNFFLPYYQDMVNMMTAGRFGLGARTGGSYENAFIDNLQITTYLQPLVGISQQPVSKTVVEGDDAFFDVRVGNSNGASFQWYSNDVAIAGGNYQTLTIPAVQGAASGSKYKVTITGPNNTVTSSEVTLTVLTPTLPATPQLSFNFDDGMTPAGTAVFGDALVLGYNGIGGSGSLQLTMAIGDQSGAFVVTDPAAGAPVYGFTARFKTLVGSGSIPFPADGFAFAFGNDIPATPTLGGPGQPRFEEGDGLGTGLVVTWDIYNNDTIFGTSTPSEAQPAPSMEIRYGGQVLATKQLPVSFMESGYDYGDTIVQLNTDATVNVFYRGVLVFDHVAIPSFGWMNGGNFALAGRTGGLYENIWVDNFELTTVTTPGEIRIISQPTDQMVLVNHFATFSVEVNDPAGTTYQWFRDGSAISGATDSSYTLPSAALTDSGATFYVQVTKGNTVASDTVGLTVVDLVPPTSPQFAFDFNDGLVPAGTGIYGNSYVTGYGGVDNSGCLHLTDALGGQEGALVVSNLVFNGAQVSAITAAFDVDLFGGSDTPADGFSFNWAAGLPDATAGGNSENGAFNTTGLAVCFRLYLGAGDNDNPPSPYIGVRYKGNFVATTQIPYAQFDTGGQYRKILLRVDEDGKLYLAYGERVLYNGLQLPDYTFIPNSKFGIYGRTGGQWDNQWFDNVQIQATQSSGPLSIATEPEDVTVIAGQTATFSAVVSDPQGATYQWSKNDVAIPGATLSSYTTLPTVVGDNGAKFKLTATGPSGTATSRDAVLTVVPPLTISNPKVIYDFNDCAIPLGTTLNGRGDNTTIGQGGYIDCSGGVTNSGVLKLTDTAPTGEGGTFIMPDLDSNEPVKALTVYFAARIGGGSTPPADGFAFVWCPSNDLPAGVIFGEDGTGGGLIVGVDLYVNPVETTPAPSIDVLYKGVLVATKQIPYPQLESGSGFADFFLRVSETGLLDLQYNGMPVFIQVAIPGYTPLAGGEFALGARTGGLNENQWFDNIAIATTTGTVPVSLEFSVEGGQLQLNWGTGWKLQSTPSLSSPNWQGVPGANPPWTVDTSTGNAFYRLAPVQ